MGGVSGAYAGTDLGPVHPYAAHFGVGMISGIAGSATRTALTGSSFTDNVMAMLPEVIGSTLGAILEDKIGARLGGRDAPAAPDAASARFGEAGAAGRLSDSGLYLVGHPMGMSFGGGIPMTVLLQVVRALQEEEIVITAPSVLGRIMEQSMRPLGPNSRTWFMLPNWGGSGEQGLAPSIRFRASAGDPAALQQRSGSDISRRDLSGWGTTRIGQTVYSEGSTANWRSWQHSNNRLARHLSNSWTEIDRQVPGQVDRAIAAGVAERTALRARERAALRQFDGQIAMIVLGPPAVAAVGAASTAAAPVVAEFFGGNTLAYLGTHSGFGATGGVFLEFGRTTLLGDEH